MDAPSARLSASAGDPVNILITLGTALFALCLLWLVQRQDLLW